MHISESYFVSQEELSMLEKQPSAEFLQLLQDSPVIAAVKNDDGLRRALDSNCTVIFILYGTILNLSELVSQVKEAGKMAFVHVDLIDGLTTRDIAADYLAHNTRADGLISTRPNLIRRAKELNLIAIQRFFLIDSLAFESVLHQSSNADAIDILPATMPRVISRLSSLIKAPIIASGLLMDKKDILNGLSAGAMAVSTTCESLWFV